jgi:hypothetical protein
VEAGVMRAWCLATLVFTGMVACDRDPASDVKIVARPVAVPGAAAVDTPTFTPRPPFTAELCAIQPETVPGKSKLAVTGPCTLTLTDNVKCDAELDDFYVVSLLHAKGEATVSMYVNIESYKGPGKYTAGQMFLTVQNGSAYYHWGSDSVETTVANGLRYVELKNVRLEAEPPNKGTELLSGRLWCHPEKNFVPSAR